MPGAALKSLDQVWTVKEGEARLQHRIITVARLHGWRFVYHTHDSRRSQPGFPDLILLRYGPGFGECRGMAIEVKTERGKVSPTQEAWLEAFALVPGFQSFVARPSNFVELERRLR